MALEPDGVRREVLADEDIRRSHPAASRFERITAVPQAELSIASGRNAADSKNARSLRSPAVKAPLRGSLRSALPGRPGLPVRSGWMAMKVR
jgi:hypothetical protein